MLLVLSALSQFSFGQTDDPSIKKYFLKVTPKGTYLRVHPLDEAGPPSRFDLLPLIEDPEILLKPGNLIGLRQVGAIQNTYTEWGGQDNIANLLGVFYGGNSFISPGPNGTTFRVVSEPNMGLPTDISEDFYIPSSTIYAEVPEGAQEILFSLNESVWYDNSDPNGDFGVWIEVSVIKPEYILEKQVIGGGDPNFIEIAP